MEAWATGPQHCSLPEPLDMGEEEAMVWQMGREPFSLVGHEVSVALNVVTLAHGFVAFSVEVQKVSTHSLTHSLLKEHLFCAGHGTYG